MDASSDAVIIESLAGIIQAWNPAAERLFGYTQQEAVGRHKSLIIPADLASQDTHQLARLKSGEPLDFFDTERLHRDGQRLPVSLSLSPIEDAQGRLGVACRVLRQRPGQDAAAEAPGAEHVLSQAVEDQAGLAEVFRQAPAFMCVMRGPDHVIQMANDRYLQLTGHRKLLRLTVREAFPEIEAQGFLGLLDAVYATGEPYIGSNVALQLTRQSGQPAEERYLDFVYQPLHDHADTITGIIAVGVDVTDRKHAEEAVRASAAQYRALFDSMDEGYCVIEMMFDAAGKAMDYRFLEINPAFAKHTGMNGAEGRTMREFVPELESAWFDTYARVLQTGESIRFIDKAEAMGSRWFDVYAFRLEGTGSPKVAVLFNDITARQWADAALRTSEARFRSLVTATSHIVWTCDADGVVVDDSPTWRAFTAQSVQQFLGRGWLDVIHPDDREATSEAWRCALAENDSFGVEYRLRRHDGEYRWMMVRAVQVRDAAGVVREWIGMNTDITDRKQVEQSLRDSEDRFRQIAADLSEADRRKDEFLATLAHELRNPLAPIRNGLQLMQLGGVQTPTMEKAHAMMERQLTQMVRLVDDLMDVSRIRLGKLLLRKERVALALILNSAVETSRPLIEQMGHELTVTMPRHTVMVEADTTRLSQVFLNLLNNAAKYSGRGGRIALDVELQGSEVVVTVADTGIGMSADQLPRIFTMFTQLHGSFERTQGGLGIGLTLVKRLVEKHGGSVEARSAGLGQGSEFVVRLPVAEDATPVLSADLAATSNWVAKSRRILVVDDNQDGADSLSAMLAAMGNDTRTAYDGKQAVEMASGYRPEVVLLDIGLPKLNGHEACRFIREQPGGQDIVLIALTGWGQDEDRFRSRDAGFDLHLVKPVDPLTLMDLITGLLRDRDADAGRAQAIE